MRFQIVFAILATCVTSAIAGACEDCQRTCPKPSEAECSKSFATSYSFILQLCLSEINMRLIYRFSSRHSLRPHLQRKISRPCASLYFLLPGRIFYLEGREYSSCRKLRSFTLEWFGMAGSVLTTEMIQLELNNDESIFRRKQTRRVNCNEAILILQQT